MITNEGWRHWKVLFDLDWPRNDHQWRLDTPEILFDLDWPRNDHKWRLETLEVLFDLDWPRNDHQWRLETLEGPFQISPGTRQLSTGWSKNYITKKDVKNSLKSKYLYWSQKKQKKTFYFNFKCEKSSLLVICLYNAYAIIKSSSSMSCLSSV